MPTSVPEMFSSSLKIEAVVLSKLMGITAQNKAEAQQCVTEGRLL